MNTHDANTRQMRSPDADRPHPARLDPDALAAECDFRTTRRSGPGGQNRNKVETAVILTHRPTGATAEASERRTQGENRHAALFRLRIRLALEYPPDGGNPTEPLPINQATSGNAAVVAAGSLINPEHEDFPALLAEALDVLAETGNDPRRAGLALGCSPSQLIKLLKNEPRALGMINDQRRQVRPAPAPVIRIDCSKPGCTRFGFI